MKPEELEAVKLNYKNIVETIFVDEIMPAMYQHGIIKSYDTMERIQSEKTTTDKACKLMQRVLKCDKPSTFQDFVAILKEYYQHLADDLNRTVSKLRRQKLTRIKVQPERPTRHLATCDTLVDDDVFTEAIPTGRDTATVQPPESAPSATSSPSVCHQCKHRVRSAISSEAGLPGLYYNGRRGSNRSHRYCSTIEILHEDEDQTIAEHGLQSTVSTNSSMNDETICKVFDLQRSLHDISVAPSQTCVKVPRTSFHQVNCDLLVDNTETIVKETVNTMFLRPPCRATENTEVQGLSVNYENLEGISEGVNLSSTNNTDINTTNICQCAGFFSTCDLHPKYNEFNDLVVLSPTIAGEDVPDSHVMHAENRNLFQQSKDHGHRNALRDSEIDFTEEGNNQNDYFRMAEGNNNDLTTTCDNPVSENCNLQIKIGIKTEPGAMQKLPRNEETGNNPSPECSPCLRRSSLGRSKDRKAVWFNVSIDDAKQESVECKEFHLRHVTLTRQDDKESFGFKYVCGTKRPRYKDDQDYYITDILPNTQASKCADLKIMYTLNSVNGHSLRGMELEDVIKLFENILTVTMVLKPERQCRSQILSFLA